MPAQDATARFSSRVEKYVLYRPSYPKEVLDLLRKQCGLTRDSVITDVASGTGIFTRILLDNGNRVFGVEPNPEMRHAGEEYLASYPRFTSIDGTAEATTLPNRSVDIVTAAQAAHWFDRAKARAEFVRILKPRGWTVLIWNERQTNSTAFLREYEQLLLTYGTDYQEVRHERTTDEIAGFFAPSPFQSAALEMRQDCDYEALEGRLLSSSYIPASGQRGYDSMLRDLRKLFDAHEANGQVVLAYTTRVYYGQIA